MTDKKYEEFYRKTLKNSPGTRLRKNLKEEGQEMLRQSLKEKIEELEKQIKNLKEKLNKKKKLKPPLPMLLIAPNDEVMLAVIYGEKTITIRNGHYDFQKGRPVIIGCHTACWAVMADVIKVRHCTLGEVTKEEYQADGFKTKRELLEGLRGFFPKIN